MPHSGGTSRQTDTPVTLDTLSLAHIMNHRLDEKVIENIQIEWNLLYVKWIQIVDSGATWGYKARQIQEDCGRWVGVDIPLANYPHSVPGKSPHLLCGKKQGNNIPKRPLRSCKTRREQPGGWHVLSGYGPCHLNVMSRSGCSLGRRFHLWSKYFWCWSQNQMFIFWISNSWGDQDMMAKLTYFVCHVKRNFWSENCVGSFM